LKLFGGTIAGGAAVAAGVNLKPASAQTGAIAPVNINDGALDFVGQFEVTQFAQRQGGVVAIGTLTGEATRLADGVIESVIHGVVLPVIEASGTCTILELTLGPLDLNLLGLMVHLDEVFLEITAQQGGGLLGDLLCAVANLLNGGLTTGLARLVRLLNQLLGALGGA
jgi:hypothetical protein